MIVLGLTGSIGMGKTATAGMFRALGVPVYDADAEVAALYAPGGAAVGPVGTAFPGSVSDGAVDREWLRRAVLSDSETLKKLERIVHPLARRAQERFLAHQESSGTHLVVLDVPLLYETGADGVCDYTLVVTAPAAVQKARVLDRTGMTEERFEQILARQMPDAEKRTRADFIVTSAFGFDFARAHVAAILHVLTNQDSRAERQG